MPKEEPAVSILRPLIFYSWSLASAVIEALITLFTPTITSRDIIAPRLQIKLY